MKSTIRVIFFDLDDTLIYEERTIAEAFADTCAVAASRRNVDAAALAKSARRIAREMWLERQGDERWGDKIGISSWEVLYGDFDFGDAPLLRWLRENVSTFRLRVWQSALCELSVNDEALARELAETFRRVVRARPMLFPETMDVLNELKRTHRLGMITNGAPDVQRLKVEGANLKGHFESIVISGDVGIGKPERGIFDHALQTMAAAPEESLMVGNSFERDVAGALGAGMRAAWLNLLNEEPLLRDARLAVISNLAELIPLVITPP